MTGRPSPDDAFPVLVLGVGTIGSGWGAWFSHRGLSVCLVDPGREPAAMQDAVATKLGQLRQSDIPGAEAAGDIAVVQSLRTLPEGIGFVQESATESLKAKRALLGELEESVSPWTVIASSTTSLKASDMQAGCRHPERVLVGHPFNPPHLLPLVEVVAGCQTDEAAVDWAMDFYRAVGKVPVRVRKEVTGHVANRLTSALFREAVHLLAEGVATAAELDDVLTHGPGLRWALQGPWLTYHLGGGAGGIAAYLEHLGDTHPARWAELGEPELSEIVRGKIVEQVLAAYGSRPVQAWAGDRDRQLEALLALKRKAKAGSTAESAEVP